jgi:ferredoxin
VPCGACLTACPHGAVKYGKAKPKVASSGGLSRSC